MAEVATILAKLEAVITAGNAVLATGDDEKTDRVAIEKRDDDYYVCTFDQFRVDIEGDTVRLVTYGDTKETHEKVDTASTLAAIDTWFGGAKTTELDALTTRIDAISKVAAIK